VLSFCMGLSFLGGCCKWAVEFYIAQLDVFFGAFVVGKAIYVFWNGNV